MIEPTGRRSNDATASDAQHFTQLFWAHHAHVLAYCRRRLPYDLADDAVAETFTTAWRTLAQAPDDQRLWLLGLARGSVANLRRHRDSFARLGDRLATLDQPRPERDHAETIGWQGPFLTAFGSLSEGDQEVLRLTTWEGLGPADTAAVLDCPTTAVKARLHRARQRLRKALGQAGVVATSPLSLSSGAHLAFSDIPPSRSKGTR